MSLTREPGSKPVSGEMRRRRADFARRAARLVREAFDYLLSRRGAPADFIALLGIFLFALNRPIAESVSEWHGFSGWYAIAWLIVLLLYGLLRGHNKIVGEYEARTAALDSKVGLLESELAEARAQPRPHIVFARVDIDTEAGMQVYVRDAYGGVTVERVPEAMSWARVLVSNDPGEKVGETARDVVATVVFYSPDGSDELLQIEGRWAEAPQAPEIDRIGLSKEGRALDLDANADPHPLDIAMKYLQEPDCFAYNNENGFKGELGRYEKHRLVGPRFLVRVSLKGTNTERVEGSFVLDNAGVGLDLALREA